LAGACARALEASTIRKNAKDLDLDLRCMEKTFPRLDALLPIQERRGA
jgi:hypothetical protein